ncbi:SPOR domain-containing protein [Bosea sp. (in: a-proteobacteria)]|uniref:SPOR domain-containing protein n=1 Tax=Bosea sp. (in: a-proteobacteria) TaxID=1871050 RepID=UPI0027363707|nr:SPOR domain-containing protein [Bosea sp. (in: a-proteobacteria)]MDP3407984.1 SPOR domain-containing protein [Bosea sp. (in: a-proteobacteria)]
MSEPARNRFALDLEDLERQLRSAGQAPRVGQPADPLAELTRIVDQGDPLKDIFGHRGQAAAPQLVPGSRPAQVQPRPEIGRQEADRPEISRHEPSFDAVQQFQAVAEQSPPPAELRGALDEFEALLRRSDAGRPAPAAVAPLRAEPRFDESDESFARPAPQSYQRAAVAPDLAPAPRDLDEERGYPAPYDQQMPGEVPSFQSVLPVHDDGPVDDDMPDLEPRRSRKGLYAAAAILVVGVVGVGAVMSLRSPTKSTDGLPPTITAAAGPTKVEPVNPGGAEIPNQNKQIYERPGETAPAQTKVVSREEQPVDVQQAARSLPTRVVLPGPGTGTATTPAATPVAPAQAPGAAASIVTPSEPLLTPVPPVPGLGEPRRVRTVSIRPDGTPAPPANGVSGYTNGAVPLSTGSAPPARPAAIAPANPTTAAVPPRPAATPAAAPAAEAAKVQERAAAPATTPSAPLRIANVAPAAQTPAAPAPATAAIRSGTGDFVVQLGAPGSESEARATFAALQRKYPGQLGGQSPIVRRTELAGGKTVFRLRVGPYSREDATSMCTALQAAGGQCFIAKN